MVKTLFQNVVHCKKRSWHRCPRTLLLLIAFYYSLSSSDYDGYFLDLFYILFHMNMDKEAHVLQALIMQWLKDGKVAVAIYPVDKKNRSRTAHLFFYPIHEHPPIAHDKEIQFFMFSNVNKPLHYLYKLKSSLAKEKQIINHNDFWEFFLETSKQVFSVKMAHYHLE